MTRAEGFSFKATALRFGMDPWADADGRVLWGVQAQKFSGSDDVNDLGGPSEN